MRKNRWLSFIMIAALLMGCTPISEENAGKDVEEPTINALSSVETEAKEDAIVTDVKMEAFQAGKTNVKVDAQLERLGTKLPVIKVKPHEFTSEDLQKWGKELFDVPLYEYFHAEERPAAYQYQNVAYIRGEIATNEMPEPGEEHYLKFNAGNYEDRDYTLYSVEQVEADRQKHSMNAEFLAEYGENIPYKECSAEEARQMVEDVLEKLGLVEEGWVIAEVQNENYGDSCSHYFRCIRYYEGVPGLDWVNITRPDDPWTIMMHPEYCSIVVENGALSLVHLESPKDIIEVEETNAKTLSQEEMLQCFKKSVQSQDYAKQNVMDEFGHEWKESMYEDISMDIEITSIKEGLACAVDENGEYRMVPAWEFRGKYAAYYNGELVVYDDECGPVMLINALDGSVISYGTGYNPGISQM